jgi:ferritin
MNNLKQIISELNDYGNLTYNREKEIFKIIEKEFKEKEVDDVFLDVLFDSFGDAKDYGDTFNFMDWLNEQIEDEDTDEEDKKGIIKFKRGIEE